MWIKRGVKHDLKYIVQTDPIIKLPDVPRLGFTPLDNTIFQKSCDYRVLP